MTEATRIHILTIHYPSTNWISIQRRYISKFVDQPFSTHAIVPKSHRGNFDFEYDNQDCGSRGIKKPSVRHQVNLNYLTKKATKEMGADDVIVILDGDALPIVPIRPLLKEWMVDKDYSVLSIENSFNTRKRNERIHCSFLAMTAGFWRRAKIDWGPVVHTAGYFISGCRDTNGRLIQYVIKNDISCHLMERTNRFEFNYPYFGIYGGSIYHHGLGFRKLNPPTMLTPQKKLIRLLYDEGCRLTAERSFCDRVNELNDRVYEYIKRDFYFYRRM